MKAFMTLQQIVKKEIPNYTELSLEERNMIVRKILSSHLPSILRKIRLPDLFKLQYRMKQEVYWNRRRRKQSKRKPRVINFALWKLLYDAKISLGYDTFQTTKISHKKTEAATSNMFIPKTISANSLLQTYDTSTSSYSTITQSSEITQFKIEEKLETKTLTNSTYSKFISCLDTTCRSPPVKQLGYVEFYLEEKLDPEIRSWNKIILNVKFYTGDIPQRIEKWEKLRDMIDESLNKLKAKEHDDDLAKLENLFFIKLI